MVGEQIRLGKILQRFGVVAVLALLLVSGFTPFLKGSAAAAVTNQSIAIPGYQYPTIGTFWSDINAAGGSKIPFVVITPNSGPGNSVDPNYTTQVATNTSNGIRTLGYVYTNYQTRTFSDVYADMDTWYQMYPGITGIFVDLVGNGTAADLCYMALLSEHFKNLHPDQLLVLNFGTNVSPAYEPYGDIFMNFENDYATYNGGWNILYPGFEDNPAYENRFWHLIHTTSPGADYTSALALSRTRNAGWVYITDETMPNPYTQKASYWNTELTNISPPAIPASTIPNRGKAPLPAGCQDLTTTTANTTSAVAAQGTTTSTFSVKNGSLLYAAEPITKYQFTLPSGVKLAGTSGANWTCTSTACSYGANIAANASTSVLTASFLADCTYATGDVGATLTNFAGNSSSFTIPVTKATSCAAVTTAGTLANTGQMTGLTIAGGAILLAFALQITSFRRRVKYSVARAFTSRRK